MAPLFLCWVVLPKVAISHWMAWFAATTKFAATFAWDSRWVRNFLLRHFLQPISTYFSFGFCPPMQDSWSTLFPPVLCADLSSFPQTSCSEQEGLLSIPDSNRCALIFTARRFRRRESWQPTRQLWLHCLCPPRGRQKSTGSPRSNCLLPFEISSSFSNLIL